MGVICLRLSETMHEQVRELAQDEGISINQFVLLALAEKISALQTINYLEERARRGSREQLLAILDKAPDVEPEDNDRLN